VPRDPTVGFEELWDAYDLKQDRRKAKAAYKALNPDAALQAQMVAKAILFAADYKGDPYYRQHLHNWIADENWLADPPRPYQAPKAAAVEKKRGGKPKAESPVAPPAPAAAKVPAKPTVKPGPGSTIDDAEKSRLLAAWAQKNVIDINEDRVPGCSDAQLYDAIKARPWPGYPPLP
jgi:hypothetical protein